MPKILVLFYSRTGSTASVADAVVEGARSVRFTEVDIRRIEDLAPEATIDADPRWKESREQLRRKYRTLESVERLAEYDGIVVGSSSRRGGISAEVMMALDGAGALGERGLLVDRVGSAFTTGALCGRGDAALWSMMTPMGEMGMILVPPGYVDPSSQPPAATATAPAEQRPGAPTPADLAMAAALGRRVAKVAEWVRHAKGHEHGNGHEHGHSHGHHHH